MDWSLVWVLIVLGIVEGLTEFLPISSTGHLILVSTLLGFHDERGKLFEIVIQSAAILAVCWEYRRRLVALFSAACGSPLNPERQQARRLIAHLGVAFVPLAVLGLLFGKTIKDVLFNAPVVATSFIVGGLLILWVERRPQQQRVDQLEQLTLVDAIKLGCAQALALIPGMSRSGATIIGGLYFGLSRQAATEFSFFLAIPTLLIASVYQLIKESHLLHLADWPLWLAGMVSSFVSAIVCVRWLLRYIASHDFRWFAWYRIVFGGVILITYAMGTVAWRG